MRVLFVCTGNICRSPSAHAVLEKKLKEIGSSVLVDSAGMGNWHAGELPDPRAQKEGQIRGYRVDHPARMVRKDDFHGLVIAMDRGHLEGLRRLAPPSFPASQLRLLRSFDPLSRDLDVADPYYGDEQDFSEMYDVIEACMPGLLSFLRAA